MTCSNVRFHHRRYILIQSTASSSSSAHLHPLLGIGLSLFVPSSTFLYQPHPRYTGDGNNVLCPSGHRTANTPLSSSWTPLCQSFTPPTTTVCLCHSLINASRSHNSALQLASETLDCYEGVTKIGVTGQCTKFCLLRNRSLAGFQLPIVICYKPITFNHLNLTSHFSFFTLKNILFFENFQVNKTKLHFLICMLFSTYIHKVTPFSHGGRQKVQNATC